MLQDPVVLLALTAAALFVAVLGYVSIEEAVLERRHLPAPLKPEGARAAAIELEPAEKAAPSRAHA